MKIYQTRINQFLNEVGISNNVLTEAEVDGFSTSSKSEFLTKHINSFDVADILHQTLKNYKSVKSGTWTEHSNWVVEQNGAWRPTRLFEFPKPGDTVQITPGNQITDSITFLPDVNETAYDITSSYVGIQDGEANGNLINFFTAGEAISKYDLIFLDTDAKWYKTTSVSGNTASGLTSIAVEDGVINTILNVAIQNSFIRNDNWSWTPGSVLYLGSTLGTITDTQPTTSLSSIRIIGYALTSSIIYFNPSQDTIILS